jgi:hypothetical protein
MVNTGQIFKGALSGADQSNLILRQETGLELLFNKGHVIYVHRVAVTKVV